MICYEISKFKYLQILLPPKFLIKSQLDIDNMITVDHAGSLSMVQAEWKTKSNREKLLFKLLYVIGKFEWAQMNKPKAYSQVDSTKRMNNLRQQNGFQHK